MKNHDGFFMQFADRVILLTNLRERILFGSTVNRFHFQLGFGLKIIIN